MMTILSLCDYTGEWSKPYRDAGYDVVQVDVKHGDDVRLFKALPYPVRGILAAPPLHPLRLKRSQVVGAKGGDAVLEGLAVVDACMRIISVHRPQWWVLENPVGRLVHYLGEPRMSFDPCEYGDDYTKKTLLWGDFNPPLKRKAVPSAGSKMHRMGGKDKQAMRSVTPAGFARAFFESNP